MMRRYSVAGAAEALGISQAAVRARIHRGTLKTERENGTVYVWVDVEQYAEQHANDAPEVADVLREQNGDLREQIEFLRDELRRKDTIIMAMTQRIPELEPAQERAEAPETTTEPGRVETHPASGGAQEGSERVSWWRRMFGG
jgi:predicted transcriptional regulator